MKATLTLLALCLLLPTLLYSQRVSRNYQDRPMADVLVDLSHAAGRQRIVFIYNDLEDYTVTQRFDSLTITDAIRACIGFYPISLTLRGDSILLVECTQKKPYKLIGRIVNERNLPVADASITLLSAAGDTLLNRGISNRNGQFVVPCGQREALARFSHVAYTPVSRRCKVGDIGTVRMKTADISIDNVSVTVGPSRDAESQYYRLAGRIEQAVWGMDYAPFSVDTMPSKYAGAPAVVLADYDHINYKNERDGKRWPHTRHLHRTRYLVNSPEAARRLSAIPYSRREDFTDFLFHKTTVMGIRIQKPDGSLRLINTHPYFKPQPAHPLESDDADTIRIDHLSVGDILDVFVYHYFKEIMSPHQFAPHDTYPTLHYEAQAKGDQSVNLQFRESSPIAGRRMENKSNKLLLRYDLRDYDSRTAKSHPQVSLYARRAKRDANRPKNAQSGGIVANPPVAQVLDDGRYIAQQKHLRRIMNLTENAFGRDSQRHRAIIRSIAREPISQREKADRLYRHFADTYLYKGRPKTMPTRHIFYATNFLDAFVQSLVLAEIPFDLAMTTSTGTPPIDQLMDVGDIVWFVRLKDGTRYFPTSGTPAGQTPKPLKGRKATLTDWHTHFNL